MSLDAVHTAVLAQFKATYSACCLLQPRLKENLKKTLARKVGELFHLQGCVQEGFDSGIHSIPSLAELALVHASLSGAFGGRRMVDI
jgi:hypothetical protein